MNCPNCGKENDDNWPITVKGKVSDGGCQDCWESECDAEWWKMIGELSDAGSTAVI